MFHCGVSIYYSQNHMTIAQDLQETQPEIFLAVPRIFEKVYSRVRDTAMAGGLLKRAVLGWSHAGGPSAGHPPLPRASSPGLVLRALAFLADRLVFSKVRVRTGGKIRLAISGGAALNPRVNEFFWSLGVPIYEGYGLTETSPILTLNGQGKVKPGTVGHPILDEWEGKPFLKLAEDGEILVRGPNVMLGYWKNEAATREVMDAEGYFHTGDVGELDETGRLKITDRKKEILVTSGGKNVAPQPIENLLRADKYIEQAVVIGDHQSFIAAIILPHFPALKLWATHKHLKFAERGRADGPPRGPDEDAAPGRAHCNTKLAKFERVRKIILIAQEMTPESGLLDPLPEDQAPRWWTSSTRTASRPSTEQRRRQDRRLSVRLRSGVSGDHLAAVEVPHEVVEPLPGQQAPDAEAGLHHLLQAHQGHHQIDGPLEHHDPQGGHGDPHAPGREHVDEGGEDRVAAIAADPHHHDQVDHPDEHGPGEHIGRQPAGVQDLRSHVEEAQEERRGHGQGSAHHQPQADPDDDAALGVDPCDALLAGPDAIADHHPAGAAETEEQREEETVHHLHDLGGGGGHHPLHAIEEGVHAHADGPEDLIDDHGQHGLDEAPQRSPGRCPLISWKEAASSYLFP